MSIQRLTKLKVKSSSPIAGTKTMKLTFDNITDVIIAFPV